MKKKIRDAQDNEANFRARHSTGLHELTTVQEEVLKYISSEIEENLRRVEAEVEKTSKACEDKKSEKINLEERIRFLDEQCRSQETGKKELENNLDLKKKLEHREEIVEDEAKLRQLMEDFQFDALKREYQQCQQARDKLEKEVCQ